MCGFWNQWPYYIIFFVKENIITLNKVKCNIIKSNWDNFVYDRALCIHSIRGNCLNKEKTCRLAKFAFYFERTLRFDAFKFNGK